MEQGPETVFKNIAGQPKSYRLNEKVVLGGGEGIASSGNDGDLDMNI